MSDDMWTDSVDSKSQVTCKDGNSIIIYTLHDIIRFLAW